MKNRRQRRILEIIDKEDIATQKGMADRLQEEGFSITQATVSRDIKELHLSKIPTDRGTYRYSRPQGAVQSGRRQLVFREFLTGYDHSQNMVVLKSAPGNANTIASVLDEDPWPEVIGTIAGDDTVLLIIKPMSAVPAVIKRIQEILEG